MVSNDPADVKSESERWTGDGWEQVRLTRAYEASLLQRDYQRLVEKFRPRPQPGTYHDGGWKGLALINGSGRALDASAALNATTGINLDARPTEALEHAPYLASVLSSLGFPVTIARVLTLAPGARIEDHRDGGMDLPNGVIRLHVPIVTNDGVDFRIDGKRCHWREGELWYGDFSRIHSVTNRSSTTRVHLVIDGELTAEALELFPQSFVDTMRERGLLPDLTRTEVSPEDLRRICGNYVLPGRVLGVPFDPIVEAIGEGGRLAISGIAPTPLKLRSLGGSRFQVAGLGATVKIDFELDGTSAPSQRAVLRFASQPEPLMAVRLPELRALDRAKKTLLQTPLMQTAHTLASVKNFATQLRKRWSRQRPA